MPTPTTTDIPEMNRLIAVPEGGAITLPDGRMLIITHWSPTVSFDSLPTVQVSAHITQEAPKTAKDVIEIKVHTVSAPSGSTLVFSTERALSAEQVESLRNSLKGSAVYKEKGYSCILLSQGITLSHVLTP